MRPDFSLSSRLFCCKRTTYKKISAAGVNQMSTLIYKIFEIEAIDKARMIVCVNVCVCVYYIAHNRAIRPCHPIIVHSQYIYVDAGQDGLTRLARPNSQARTVTGEKVFPVQLTTSRIGNHPYPVDSYSAESADRPVCTPALLDYNIILQISARSRGVV